MNKTLLLFLLFASIVRGDTETLYCDTVSSPDQWTNFGGADKATSVSDTIDDNFIDETTQGQIQRFTLVNPANIDETDRIDSIIVRCRLMTPSGAGVVARANHIVSSTAYGTNRNLTSSWADYQEAYSTDPAGNDWTLSNINSLKIEAEAVTIPILKRARCTRIFVEVYFTPVPAAPRRRIYQQYLLMGE